MVRDEETGTPAWAQAIKIDHGYAFLFCGRTAEDAAPHADNLNDVRQGLFQFGTQARKAFVVPVAHLPTNAKAEFDANVRLVLGCCHQRR